MCYDKRHNGYKRLKLFDIKPHKGVAAVSEKNTKLYDGISEFALYLFGEGTNHQAYDMLGAHPYKKDGAEGYRFAVWAPNAASVCVTGTFNDWDVLLNPMEQIGDTGVWYTFIPGIAEGCMYKFAITDKDPCR